MSFENHAHIFLNTKNIAYAAQEVIDGLYFERIITNSKINDFDDLDSPLLVGNPTLIYFEHEKALENLEAGDKILIKGFAISYGRSFTFEPPVNFIIPSTFVKQDNVANELADNEQQVKIDNLREAINKLRNYGDMLAQDNTLPPTNKRAKEFIYDNQIDLKARKGIEAFLLANQLDKKLNHFLCNNPAPDREAYTDFAREMKELLHEKSLLFATHRNETILIIRDIILALTLIAPIIWIGKSIHSSLTNGNYSLFHNKTETKKNVDHIEEITMNL